MDLSTIEVEAKGMLIAPFVSLSTLTFQNYSSDQSHNSFYCGLLISWSAWNSTWIQINDPELDLDKNPELFIPSLPVDEGLHFLKLFWLDLLSVSCGEAHSSRNHFSCLIYLFGF